MAFYDGALRIGETTHHVTDGGHLIQVVRSRAGNFAAVLIGALPLPGRWLIGALVYPFRP